MDTYYIESPHLQNGLPVTFTCTYQEQIGLCPVVEPHLHDKIELLYCTEGAYRAVLGGTEYTYQKGDLLIVNSREIHQTWSISDGTNACWVLQFYPEVLYNATLSIVETQYVTPFVSNHVRHPRVITAEDIKKTDIPRYLNELIDEHRKQEFGFELVERACICRIVADILRLWNEQELYVQEKKDTSQSLMRTMQGVLDYAQQHFTENISVSEMAKMCNMSYSYFSRQFKRIISMSFSDYINHLRITQGEKLLSSTNKSITEVAMEVGFSDTSYFIQKFKQFKGISPGKFKANYSLNGIEE